MGECNPATLEILTLAEATIQVRNGEIRRIVDRDFILRGTGLSRSYANRAVTSMIGRSYPGGDGTIRVFVHLTIERTNIESETIVSCDHDGDPAYERIKCSWDEKRTIQLGDGYNSPIRRLPDNHVENIIDGKWCPGNIAGDILQIGAFVGSFFVPALLPIGIQKLIEWLEELQEVQSASGNKFLESSSILKSPIDHKTLAKFINHIVDQDEDEDANLVQKSTMPDTASSLMLAVMEKTGSKETKLVKELKESPTMQGASVSFDELLSVLGEWSVERTDSRLLLDLQFVFSELVESRLLSAPGLKRDQAWAIASSALLNSVESWPSKKGHE